MCKSVCSNGTRKITGCCGDVFVKIREVAPQVTHCSLHREALATKATIELNNVLDQSVKVVNFIKCRPLNSRFLTILCNETGSNHNKLLLHTEFRWLTRGKVLTRLFELRSKAQIRIRV